MSNFDALGLLPLSLPPYAGQSLIERAMIVKRAFKCVLIADGLPDLELPISAINGTLNANALSTLNIVCSDGKTYAADIAARAAGDFRLTFCEWMLDGSYIETVFPDFHIDRPASDRGASSWSISIAGTKTLSNNAPVTYNAVGETIVSVNSDGKRRIRLDINAQLKAGDSLLLESGESIVSRAITYTISASPTAAYMTVSEE